VKYRSPERFIRSTISIVASGIYKNIGAEVAAITTVAALIVIWNALCGSYDDFSNVRHPGVFYDILPVLTLPVAPFTLLSTSLGLLLGKFVQLVIVHVPLFSELVNSIDL
jgi:hypothetical protein